MNKETMELIYMIKYAQDMVPAMLDVGRNWGFIDGEKGTGFTKIPNLSDVFPSAGYVCQQLIKRKEEMSPKVVGIEKVIGRMFVGYFAGVASVLLWKRSPGERKTPAMLDEILREFNLANFENEVVSSMGIVVGSREHGDLNGMLLGIISTTKDIMARNPSKFDLLQRAAAVAMAWYGQAYMIHRLGIKGNNC